MEDVIKSRFRFTEEVDLHLAREVYGQNPYEDPRRWFIIQVNMLQIITGRSISTRTLKERIQNLVKKYLTKSKLNEGKSGVEEIVTELDDLLQQIVELIKTFQNNSNKNMQQRPATTVPVKSSFQKGFDGRENYVANMLEASTSKENIDLLETYMEDMPSESLEMENVSIEIENNENVTDVEPEAQPQAEKGGKKYGTTPRKRPLAQANILSAATHKRTYTNIKEHTLQYLNKKNDRQYEVRSRELAVLERKQSLEERKFELEAEERKKRIEMEERRLTLEEKRLNVHLDIFQNQQTLIKSILQRNL